MGAFSVKEPLYYMASVYSQFQQGQEQAYIEASKSAAILLKRGLNVFSPVAHSHPIAAHGDINKIDHDFWMRLDIAILDACDHLLVLMMPGWRESKGIGMEVAHAKATGKPITYLSWPSLNERENESI